MKEPIFLHPENMQTLRSDPYHTVYAQTSPGGYGTVAVYPIAPGIEVSVVDFRAVDSAPPARGGKNILEINHCLEGRFECEMADGCVQFVGEGDVFISTLDNHSSRITWPLGYYKGIVITLDLALASDEIDSLLPGLLLDLAALKDRLFTCEGCHCLMIRASEDTRALFGRMYTAPEDTRPFLYRQKAAELLLYLRDVDPPPDKRTSLYTKQQVEIAKQVHKQLTENLSHRYTIEELAGLFCIGTTALKSHFKGVYGQPIAAYMKAYRIRAAADMLRESDKTVAEIAHTVGYESQGKFTAAFRQAMGITPTEYRQKT